MMEDSSLRIRGHRDPPVWGKRLLAPCTNARYSTIALRQFCDNGVGAAHRPIHAGAFEGSANSHFATGLDHASGRPSIIKLVQV
jgi:hypothetical protein